jgi:hypothetical protein
VNAGSEPERDDTGLPPVDIEIPDDARDLDRDVQAYYRELRANRREQRGRRMRGSLARDGVVLPLLVCCLILALITGTLLTVFTATSDRGLGLLGGGSPAAGALPPPDVQSGPRPTATIAVNGQPVAVHGLKKAALVLIPAGCNCTAEVDWLIGVASSAGAKTYLVYTIDSATTVRQLYGQLTASHRQRAILASEPDPALAESVPPGLRAKTLTAIMLGPSRVVYATMLGPGRDSRSLSNVLIH